MVGFLSTFIQCFNHNTVYHFRIITCKMNLRLLIFPTRDTQWQISLINKPNYWLDILKGKKSYAMSSKCRIDVIAFYLFSSLYFFFLVYKSLQVVIINKYFLKKNIYNHFLRRRKRQKYEPFTWELYQVQFRCHFQSYLMNKKVWKTLISNREKWFFRWKIFQKFIESKERNNRINAKINEIYFDKIIGSNWKLISNASTCFNFHSNQYELDFRFLCAQRDCRWQQSIEHKWWANREKIGAKVRILNDWSEISAKGFISNSHTQIQME